MFLGAAEANTSAGAPLLICSASAELAPKLNFTVSPGWAVSNCLPISVNVPFSDDAANTVIDPVCAAGLLLVAGADELVGLEAGLEVLLEQPATAIAASATAVRAKRRMFNSLVLSSRARSPGPGNLTGPGERHSVHSEPRRRTAS